MTKLNGWKMACSLFGLCVAMTIAVTGQTFETLATFVGPNGSRPSYMLLVQGRDGNFYGTTFEGGANSGGTVFKLSGGGLTTLHNFCTPPNCSDGIFLYSGLTLATDGDFYGVTASGGASHKGTVFKITPSGKLTTLTAFAPLSPTVSMVQIRLPRLFRPSMGAFTGQRPTVEQTAAVRSSRSARVGCQVGFTISVINVTLAWGPYFKVRMGTCMALPVTRRAMEQFSGLLPKAGLQRFTAFAPSPIVPTEQALKVCYSPVTGIFMGLACRAARQLRRGWLWNGLQDDSHGRTHDALHVLLQGFQLRRRCNTLGRVDSSHSWGIVWNYLPRGEPGNPTCGAQYVGCGTVFKITLAGSLTTLYSFESPANRTLPAPALALT